MSTSTQPRSVKILQEGPGILQQGPGNSRGGQVIHFAKFTNQSPIYDTVADSIHVNKESPGYSEVIPCGQLESGYCSLSPFKSQRSPSKCAPKQPSLNRRRSKSMEDIYSISAKFNHVDVSRKPVVRREEVDVAVSYAPPIPDRNYSPVKLLSPKHSFNTRSSVSIKTPASSTTSASPSTVKADLFQRLVGIQEISPKKRRSQEGDENVRDSASPVKKTKPESHETSDLFADKDSFASISDPKLVESTPYESHHEKQVQTHGKTVTICANEMIVKTF
ncbi:hypothetical protein Btru_055898 [Bulinus truncatus]|nr:hypothetical protein Btru_055898 [Bulinus truncatus]